MGEIEQKVKRRVRKNELKHIILGTVGAMGLISIALVAPNVIGALGKMGFINPNARRKEIINRARDRLIDHKLLKRDEKGYLQLTEKGARELRKLELATVALKKPKRWDRKWRILAFDIPEHRRKVRDKVRLTLMVLGFSKLQNSVWIHPYPCEDFVALLKTDLGIGKDLLYIVTDEIENDQHLRSHFGLPKD